MNTTNIEIEITPIDEVIDALMETIKEFFLQDTLVEFISPRFL